VGDLVFTNAASLWAAVIFLAEKSTRASDAYIDETKKSDLEGSKTRRKHFSVRLQELRGIPLMEPETSRAMIISTGARVIVVG
jgi:hypothetical protein